MLLLPNTIPLAHSCSRAPTHAHTHAGVQQAGHAGQPGGLAVQPQEGGEGAAEEEEEEEDEAGRRSTHWGDGGSGSGPWRPPGWGAARSSAGRSAAMSCCCCCGAALNSSAHSRSIPYLMVTPAPPLADAPRPTLCPHAVPLPSHFPHALHSWVGRRSLDSRVGTYCIGLGQMTPCSPLPPTPSTRSVHPPTGQGPHPGQGAHPGGRRGTQRPHQGDLVAAGGGAVDTSTN